MAITAYSVAALNMKEIQYDIKPINIQKGEGDHQSEEYQKINPMRKVPALHIDGHTIFESVCFNKAIKS